MSVCEGEMLGTRGLIGLGIHIEMDGVEVFIANEVGKRASSRPTDDKKRLEAISRKARKGADRCIRKEVVDVSGGNV